MWEAGRGKTFISVFHLSFCTRQANCLRTSGRCLSLHPLRKLCYAGWPACSRLRNIRSTQVSLGWGDCVCATSSQTLSGSLFLPSHTDMQTQTDGVCLGHAVASPGWVRPSAYLESICSLPSTDPETAGLSVASSSVAFLYWGGEEGPREEGLGDDEVGKNREGSV